MNITKEQAIDLFKKTLNNLKDRNSLLEEEFVFGVKITENISVISTALSKSNDESKPEFDYSIKVLFGGFVEYKSIDITKEEYEDLNTLYLKTDTALLLVEKKNIIETCENELSLVLGN